MEIRPEFIADKASGAEGSIYGFSIIPDVIRWSNQRSIFKFPFHGLTTEDAIQKTDEWIDTEAYTKTSQEILAHVVENGVAYFEKLKEQVAKEGELLLQKSVETRKGLESLTDVELAERYHNFMAQYAYYYGPPVITFVYEGILSERLSVSLSTRYEEATSIIGDLLASPYKSFMIENEEALEQIKKVSDTAIREELIDDYQNSFFFIRANYSYTPEITRASILEAALASHAHEQKPATPIKEVQLSTEEKAIVSLLRESEVIRDKRKKLNLVGSYTMFRFLDEVCRRKGVEVSLGKRLFWYELVELLVDTEHALSKIKNRKAGTAVFDGTNCLYLDYIAIKPRVATDLSAKEVKGTGASKGKVTGRVRIVLGSPDFGKFQDGEVLVTEMTRPDFVQLMKRALAIVTDEGGLTCHAAIVARELHKPCIIGTKIATQVLKDGDMVEVDANTGTVKIL